MPDESKPAEKRITWLSALVIAFLALVLGVTGGRFGYRLIREFLPSPPTPSTPVVVRGGAMTFRGASGATIELDHDQNLCFVLGKVGATVTLSVTQNFNNGGTTNYSGPLGIGALIDFKGRQHSGYGEGNYGVQVKITDSCGGSNLGASFSPENGKAGYYPGRGPDEDGSYYLRYWDKTASGGPGQNDDEDNAEHMSKVYLTGAHWDNGASWQPCKDGECEIRFSVQ
jgi:hypothetical protein